MAYRKRFRSRRSYSKRIRGYRMSRGGIRL